MGTWPNFLRQIICVTPITTSFKKKKGDDFQRKFLYILSLVITNLCLIFLGVDFRVKKCVNEMLIIQSCLQHSCVYNQ